LSGYGANLVMLVLRVLLSAATVRRGADTPLFNSLPIRLRLLPPRAWLVWVVRGGTQFGFGARRVTICGVKNWRPLTAARCAKVPITVEVGRATQAGQRLFLQMWSGINARYSGEKLKTIVRVSDTKVR
jgi:hypothetical protein